MKRLVELRTSKPAAAGKAEPTPLVARSLALATLIVLGEADEAHVGKVAPLLAEAKSSDCLKMAKLNLFQCLSVAGPQYEDVFCVGEHGLSEAAQCLASAVGVTAPAPQQAAAPVLLAAAEPPPLAGVSVPIALLADSGPERSAAFASVAAPVVAPLPAPAAPIQLAQAPPAAAMLAPEAPTWSRESIARTPERDPNAPTLALRRADPAPAIQEQSPPAYAARADRGLAYRWDRQTRPTGYARQPAYDPRQASDDRYEEAGDRYVDPRAAYGRYQPRQPPLDAYARGYADEEDDGAAADDRAAPSAYLPNIWGVR